MGSEHSTPPPPPAQGPRGGERVNGEESAPERTPSGYREFQEIMLRIANNPDLGTPYNPRGLPEPPCGMSASHRADSVLHDYAFDDEDPARLGEEAAYCRAAADSHAGDHTSYDPGAAEAGSAPFKGQGSVMYSYRESSKMRFGTLNVKGSIQGAPGVSRHCVQCLLVP